MGLKTSRRAQLTTDSVADLLALLAVADREDLELSIDTLRWRGRRVWVGHLYAADGERLIAHARASTLGELLTGLRQVFLAATAPRT